MVFFSDQDGKQGIYNCWPNIHLTSLIKVYIVNLLLLLLYVADCDYLPTFTMIILLFDVQNSEIEYSVHIITFTLTKHVRV